ncbi:MAG: hypothetical protein HWD58_21055 [Bacteroidota bacterium]|nr:MAG: hypothetical protein HWD58_21055 [Bacteroidota bacterium]
MPNTTYNILVGEGQFNAGNQSLNIGGTLYNFSPSNTGQGPDPDLNDNDFSPSTLSSALGAQPAGLPMFTITTGNAGYVNHTIDLGIRACVVDAGNNLSLSCNNPSGQIGTPGISGYTYSWLPTAGLSDPSIAQPIASPSVTTTYTLTVNGLCTDQVTVTVNGVFPTADAGIDKTLDCLTTFTTIGTSAIGGNTYSWSPATGLSATNIAQPTSSPTTTTTYTVTVTGSNGCTATDVVTVNVNTTPPTVDAGMDKNLDCTTTSTTIGTTAIVGNTYSWSPSTGLNATNIAEPTASPTSTTTYTVTVTGSNGCTATDVVTVNVNITPPTVDAGMDKDLDCTTTSTTIGTTAIGGNSYSWSPSTGLSADNIAEPTASPSTTTSYTVTVTGSNGCTATDVVTVNVNTTPPTIDAGMDKDLDCTTTSTTIGTTAIGGNTYSWSPSSGLNATNIAQPTASPTTTTTYTVTVTGSNGCTATDVVTVNVNTTPPTRCRHGQKPGLYHDFHHDRNYNDSWQYL